MYSIGLSRLFLERLKNGRSIHRSPVRSVRAFHAVREIRPQDYVQALTWYRKAADQGLADAQYSLGYLYANGHEVPQDYVQAHLWLNLSAAQNNTVAATNRDDVAKLMTTEQMSRSPKRKV
jgi:TPR repeat protein